jgi:hypothetical protein
MTRTQNKCSVYFQGVTVNVCEMLLKLFYLIEISFSVSKFYKKKKILINAKKLNFCKKSVFKKNFLIFKEIIKAKIMFRKQN